MGHARVRPDKHCLNCGRTVEERYCTHCGQENVVPKESFGHLIRHFFEDLTHFDSKFYRYYLYLMTRPGFLTREYLAGRRAAWFNPIRAYIFISFVFFLVIFSGKKEPVQEDHTEELEQVQQQIANDLRHTAGTILPATAYDSLKRQVLESIATQLSAGSDSSRQEQTIAFNVNSKGVGFTLKDNRYKDLREYDSVQNALPDTAAEKNKGFVKWIIRTNLRLKNEYGSRRTVRLEENFQHSVPKLTFILLPVFALFVGLFYKRKQYYYTQHVIFSLHYHSFVFLLYLVLLLLKWLIPFPTIGLVMSLLFLGWTSLYLVLALRHTYQQSFGLSLAKALGILSLYFITLVVAILLLALVTFVMA